MFLLFLSGMMDGIYSKGCNVDNVRSFNVNDAHPSNLDLYFDFLKLYQFLSLLFLLL